MENFYVRHLCRILLMSDICSCIFCNVHSLVLFTTWLVYVLPNSLKNQQILLKKINILFDFYKSPRAVTKFVEILFHGTFTLLMLRIIETGPWRVLVSWLLDWSQNCLIAFEKKCSIKCSINDKVRLNMYYCNVSEKCEASKYWEIQHQSFLC